MTVIRPIQIKHKYITFISLMKKTAAYAVIITVGLYNVKLTERIVMKTVSLYIVHVTVRTVMITVGLYTVNLI